MPEKQRRESGFRISFQVPEDVEKIFQRQRTAYRKVFGFTPSRSEMMAMMVRTADRYRDWLKSPREKETKETNGQ